MARVFKIFALFLSVSITYGQAMFYQSVQQFGSGNIAIVNGGGQPTDCQFVQQVGGSGNIGIVNGAVVNEFKNDDSVELDEIFEINANGNGNLHIQLGARDSLDIKASEEVLQNVVVKFENGTLYLDYKNDLKKDVSLDFYITLRNVKKISKKGNGVVYLKGPFNNTSSLMLSASERGCISVDGLLKTPQLTIEESGDGDITIQNVIAVSLIVKIMESGNLKVSGMVNQQQISISGYGVYSGNMLKAYKTAISVGEFGKAEITTVTLSKYSVSRYGDLIVNGSRKF